MEVTTINLNWIRDNLTPNVHLSLTKENINSIADYAHVFFPPRLYWLQSPPTW